MKRKIIKVGAVLLLAAFAFVFAASSFLNSTAFAQSTKEYEIEITTIRANNGGIKDKIYIKFIGELGSTEWLLLNTYNEKIEQNKSISYTVFGEDVGNVKQIKIWHDGEEVWAMSDFTFMDKKYYVPLVDSKNYTYTVNVEYNNNGERLYEIGIRTMDWFDLASKSDTDDDIYVKFVGENGETDFMLLDWDSYEDFNANAYDYYYLSGKDVGAVKQIIFWNDGIDSWGVATCKFEGNNYSLFDSIENETLTIKAKEKNTYSTASVFTTLPSPRLLVALSLVAVVVVVGVVLLKRKKAAESGENAASGN